MNSYQELKQRLAERFPAMELREGEPLSAHTSFKVGGPVPLMAFPDGEAQAVFCVGEAARLGIPLLILGNGSNILAADEGADRFVVSTIRMDAIRLTETGEIEAGAGVLLSRLAIFAATQGKTGLEFAHGIPGTLAGAIVMNAGAYGGEMATVVRRTRFLNAAGEIEEIEGEAHNFSYRHSYFSEHPGVILSAVLSLQPGVEEEIRQTMRLLAEKRRSSQPLEYPSAGSMFKRPPGHYAAALIEQCGLKGLTVGGAQVSEKHSGFVINRGGATCRDILSLVEQVKARVLAETGVELCMEVKLVP